MNELPGDQPAVWLWHLCRSWCWQCRRCYRPPRCTMAIVKDHSTLTHAQINRKIIYPLIDLTIQINFILTMKCSQIWGGVMWIWVRGWSLWSAAPPAPHNLPVVWVMSDVRVSLMSQSDLHRSSESISCPNSWLMSLMSFCFTQSRGSKIIINLSGQELGCDKQSSELSGGWDGSGLSDKNVNREHWEQWKTQAHERTQVSWLRAAARF